MTTDPKPTKPMKAFLVSEDWHIGQSEIVWATCHAAARREMLGEWGMEFNQVKAKRLPELDDFTGDLNRYKWDHGWWGHCEYSGCSKEQVTEGDEGSIYDDGFYCYQEHAHLQREVESRRKAQVADAEAAARELLPGVTFGRSFVNVGGDVMLDLRFPNGEHFTITYLDRIREVPEVRERWAKEIA